MGEGAGPAPSPSRPAGRVMSPTRGGAARYLAVLIAQRSQVRILPPLLTRVRKSVPDSEDRRNRAGLRCVAGRFSDGFPDFPDRVDHPCLRTPTLPSPAHPPLTAPFAVPPAHPRWAPLGSPGKRVVHL